MKKLLTLALLTVAVAKSGALSDVLQRAKAAITQTGQQATEYVGKELGQPTATPQEPKTSPPKVNVPKSIYDPFGRRGDTEETPGSMQQPPESSEEEDNGAE